MTRGSGVTPCSARSKVVRITPFACASGQSRAVNSAKDDCGACARAQTAENAKISVAQMRKDRLRMRRLQQGDQAAAVAFQTAGEFKFQQHRTHDGWRGLRKPHQV